MCVKHPRPPPLVQGSAANTSPSKLEAAKGVDEDEDEEGDVDIWTLDEQRIMSSDEEDELQGQLHHLPVVRRLGLES